ncbi:MAG TPA: hypothetical protein VJK54_08125 [Chthoniobacterales bacterium]|nr:hypothetical protein [Chthoniobacterales bacterium]
MKIFISLGIVGLTFLASTGLYAEDAQIKLKDQRHNGQLSSAGLSSQLSFMPQLMMNPTTLEETEEAIEELVNEITGAVQTTSPKKVTGQKNVEYLGLKRGFFTESPERLRGARVVSPVTESSYLENTGGEESIAVSSLIPTTTDVVASLHQDQTISSATSIEAQLESEINDIILPPLTLEDFRIAAGTYPDAARLILVEEGESVFIQARDDEPGDVDGNNRENKKIIDALKKIVPLGGADDLLQYNNITPDSDVKPLTGERLRDIIERIDEPVRTSELGQGKGLGRRPVLKRGGIRKESLTFEAGIANLDKDSDDDSDSGSDSGSDSEWAKAVALRKKRVIAAKTNELINEAIVVESQVKQVAEEAAHEAAKTMSNYEIALANEVKSVNEAAAKNSYVTATEASLKLANDKLAQSSPIEHTAAQAAVDIAAKAASLAQKDAAEATARATKDHDIAREIKLKADAASAEAMTKLNFFKKAQADADQVLISFCPINKRIAQAEAGINRAHAKLKPLEEERDTLPFWSLTARDKMDKMIVIAKEKVAKATKSLNEEIARAERLVHLASPSKITQSKTLKTGSSKIDQEAQAAEIRAKKIAEINRIASLTDAEKEAGFKADLAVNVELKAMQAFEEAAVEAARMGGIYAEATEAAMKKVARASVKMSNVLDTDTELAAAKTTMKATIKEIYAKEAKDNFDLAAEKEADMAEEFLIAEALADRAVLSAGSSAHRVTMAEIAKIEALHALQVAQNHRDSLSVLNFSVRVEAEKTVAAAQKEVDRTSKVAQVEGERSKREASTAAVNGKVIAKKSLITAMEFVENIEQAEAIRIANLAEEERNAEDFKAEAAREEKEARKKAVIAEEAADDVSILYDQSRKYKKDTTDQVQNTVRAANDGKAGYAAEFGERLAGMGSIFYNSPVTIPVGAVVQGVGMSIQGGANLFMMKKKQEAAQAVHNSANATRDIISTQATKIEAVEFAVSQAEAFHTAQIINDEASKIISPEAHKAAQSLALARITKLSAIVRVVQVELSEALEEVKNVETAKNTRSFWSVMAMTEATKAIEKAYAKVDSFTRISQVLEDRLNQSIEAVEIEKERVKRIARNPETVLVQATENLKIAQKVRETHSTPETESAWVEAAQTVFTAWSEIAGIKKVALFKASEADKTSLNQEIQIAEMKKSFFAAEVAFAQAYAVLIDANTTKNIRKEVSNEVTESAWFESSQVAALAWESVVKAKKAACAMASEVEKPSLMQEIKKAENVRAKLVSDVAEATANIASLNFGKINNEKYTTDFTRNKTAHLVATDWEEVAKAKRAVLSMGGNRQESIQRLTIDMHKAEDQKVKFEEMAAKTKNG